MGRKSKLTDLQWAKVETRLLEGEAARKLAREFGVSEAAVRQRKGSRVETIKQVANQIVSADRALHSLPISSQRITLTWVAKLQLMSSDLLDAAMAGASTASHLNQLANTEAKKVTGRNLKTKVGGEHRRMVGELTELANDAADMALRIVTSQKEQVRAANQTQPVDAPDLSALTFEELAKMREMMVKATGQPAELVHEVAP